MYRPIDVEELAPLLRRMNDRTVYLHAEVTPGGFMRNIPLSVEEAVIRTDGSVHRLALRCRGSGWVVMEGLTHVADGEKELFMLCAFAEEDRLTRVIQISQEALPS